MKGTGNKLTLKKGGELGIYQTEVSPNDALKIWFKPEYSGELGDTGLKALEGKLKLALSYIDSKGNVKEGNDLNFSFTASKSKIIFTLPEGDLNSVLVNDFNGTLLIRIEMLDEDGVTYTDMGLETEARVTPTLDKAFLLASQVSQHMGTIAERDTTNVNVLKPTMQKSELAVLWKMIEESTNRISYNCFEQYANRIFCMDGSNDKHFKALSQRRYLPFSDTDGYRVLKIAAESFVMLHAGVCCNFEDIDSEEELYAYLSRLDIRFAADDKAQFKSLWDSYLKQENGLFILPYLYLLRQKFQDAGITSNWIDNLIEEELCKCGDSDRSSTRALQERCFGIVRQRLQCPLFIELIWSYWQEEGMLVQCMNAISRRFQNIRTPGIHDPLVEMEISHLRPLNNLLWGYIQDDQHRLTVLRRAYEYDHHYGITLQGKAVQTLNSADSRTRFIEAFHGTLNLAAKHYADATNKLVEPDTYPLLNALREVHFIIAEGMHNQYGDLPCTARIEMLMQQWILARPEFREFLPGRAAIPYTEPWMDRVAAMNRLQNWTDVSPMQYDYLAKYGEQILLSIRFGDWSNQKRNHRDAALWANYFRSQVQGYIHAYKTVTGVDLTTTTSTGKIDALQPSVHLVRRLQERQAGKIPAPSQPGIPLQKDAIKKEW